MHALRILTLAALCAACSAVADSPEGDEIGESGSSSDTTGDETETAQTVTHVCGDAFDLLECESNFCKARWTGSDAWSSVLLPGIVDLWPPVDPVGLFPCDPIPPVDGCGKMDDVGHVACWVYEGECARIAAPLCTLTDASETNVWPDWMPCDAGEPIGTALLCTDTQCWIPVNPTSAVAPHC